METQTDNITNNNADSKTEVRRGRRPSAPRERMVPCDAVIEPLEGGRVARIVQTAKGNGGRLYRLRYAGLWRVTCSQPVTMLEAWIAATGTPPEALGELCGVTANTIRNQTFCPQIVKALANATGIGTLTLASNKEQAEWLFSFDGEGKVQGSDIEILTEPEKQLLAARAGIVLPPKVA